MVKFRYAALLLAGFVFAGNVSVFAVEWIRVKSDDGKFSAEVPADYDAFFDKDGFWISDSNARQSSNLRNVYIFNSLIDGTLVGFEVFDTNESGWVVDRLREMETSSINPTKSTKLKTADGVEFRQTLIANNNYHLIRRFFSRAGRVYVLTAASRNGETPDAKRFLDSVKIDPRDSLADATLLSKLKMTEVKVFRDTDSKPATSTPKPTATPPVDPSEKKMQILTRPRPSFTNAARSGNETGTVSFRVGFTENGGINEFVVKKELAHGLVRQCLFAALRTRMLPPEKDGKPFATKRTIEYSFAIF